MATPRLKERGFGFISRPSRITREENGTISQGSIDRIQSQLDTITTAINGGITLRSGGSLGRAGNMKAQMVEFTSSPTANVEFLVPHSLGEAPEGYIVVLQNKAASLYTSNFGGWDGSAVYFKCSVASVLMNVILYS